MASDVTTRGLKSERTAGPVVLEGVTPEGVAPEGVRYKGARRRLLLLMGHGTRAICINRRFNADERRRSGEDVVRHFADFHAVGAAAAAGNLLLVNAFVDARHDDDGTQQRFEPSSLVGYQRVQMRRVHPLDVIPHVNSNYSFYYKKMK